MVETTVDKEEDQGVNNTKLKSMRTRAHPDVRGYEVSTKT